MQTSAASGGRKERERETKREGERDRERDSELCRHSGEQSAQNTFQLSNLSVLGGPRRQAKRLKEP